MEQHRPPRRTRGAPRRHDHTTMAMPSLGPRSGPWPPIRSILERSRSPKRTAEIAATPFNKGDFDKPLRRTPGAPHGAPNASPGRTISPCPPQPASDRRRPVRSAPPPKRRAKFVRIAFAFLPYGNPPGRTRPGRGASLWHQLRHPTAFVPKPSNGAPDHREEDRRDMLQKINIVLKAIPHLGRVPPRRGPGPRERRGYRGRGGPRSGPGHAPRRTGPTGANHQ